MFEVLNKIFALLYIGRRDGISASFSGDPRFKFRFTFHKFRLFLILSRFSFESDVIIFRRGNVTRVFVQILL